VDFNLNLISITNNKIVDFQKGCYLGQELTIRVKHTGIVRKRVVKISALDGFASLASGYQITSGGKMVGNSLSCLGSRGLAFMRLENVDSPDLELVYGNGEKSVKLVAELPEYLKLD
jgi:folate-binding Fe-S cluster repair protein YgfZ